MRLLVTLLVGLMLVLTGCPRLPGLVPDGGRSLLGEVQRPPLVGRVQWSEDYGIQATATEVSNGATVSLIDPATGQTLTTALTQPDGSFSLNLKGTFTSDRPYLLEASKGLSAGASPNRAGAPAARLRTLVSLSSGSWTSLSGTTVRLNPSSTALCIVSVYRALTLPQQQALMATLPPATGAYAGTPTLPAADFTSVQALVTASLTLDQDPVHVIARNTLTGAYVRMERGPFITNVSSLRSLAGTIITLYGTGLDTVVANNLVSFNGTPASSMSLVPGGIAVSVPVAATTGPLTLRVGNLEMAVGTFQLPMTTIQTLVGTNAPAAGTLGPNWGVYPDKNTVDRNGNCYFVDGQTIQIYKVASPSLEVSLFAGVGGYGYAGDNGPATKAKFSGVGGMATDAAGNLYIADGSNYRVRKVDALTGIITTVAGNGSQGNPAEGATAAAAPLYGPSGLAVDAAGNLYIVDNKRVRKVSAATGLITTYAGGTVDYTSDGVQATTVGLDDPRGLATDGAGNLYINQYSSTKYVRKVDPSGIITTVAGAAPSLTVAVDEAGNVYYTTSNTVHRIAPGGSNTILAGITNQFGSTGDNGPATSAKLGSTFYGLSCTPGGAVFISDTNNWRFRKVENGIITTIAGTGSRSSGDSGQALAAQLASVAGVIYDAAGNLYVADSSAYRVRKISATGVITTFAGTGANATGGGNGGPAASATFGSLSDLAVGASGSLYVTDGATVRKIGADGIISHYAGGGASLGDNGPATSAKFASASGLALDSAGNLYVADYSDGRIRKIDKATGIISTVVGTGSGGSTGDGGPATAASIANPMDLAFDGADNMYICGYNYNVRKVSKTTGIITTIAGNGNSGFAGDGGLAVNARVDYQSGIAVDSVGNVYISANGRIRVVDAGTGIIRTLAGTSVNGYNGDGAPATGIQLNSPGRLIVDSANQLVFCDSSNYMVRRLQ